MYVGYGLCNAGGCSCFNGLHEDAIAVVIVCDDEIIVAMARQLREASCLVSVHHMLRLCGSQKTGVCSGVVQRWCWEEIVIGAVGVGGGFCAARVFALSV